MSTTSVVLADVKGALATRWADYIELTKPRIAVMELVTVAVAAFVARWGVPAWDRLVPSLLGTALVAASASALNQLLERRTDALMPRTAQRPLPAGRLSAYEVAMFAWTGVAGVLLLALMVNYTTALLGFITWALYVAVYTPLKVRTPLNTFVGAVAGGLPVLMGWATVDGRFDLAAATLFMILFLWQFPHFMAIAWLYRRQYAAAGLKMLPVVDPTGRSAGVQAVAAALLLVPVSLLPAVLTSVGQAYFLAALALGGAQLAAALAFRWQMDECSARRLLRATLLYLPALLAALMLGPLVG